MIDDDDKIQQIIEKLLSIQAKSKREALKTYRSTMHPDQQMKRICRSIIESKQVLHELKIVTQKIQQENAEFMRLNSNDDPPQE